MPRRPPELTGLLDGAGHGGLEDFDYGGIGRQAPMRASYAAPTTQAEHRLFAGLATEGGAGGMGLRRAFSVPALTSEKLRDVVAMSPLFYRRYYMSKAGTMTSSAFNLVSATLGAGVLALPSAMQHSGVVLGSVALALICAATVYSVHLLVRVGELVGLSTYEELAAALVGRGASHIAAAMIVIFCWGVAVMYVVVMGDFVAPLIDAAGLDGVLSREVSMVLFWLLLMFPLSLAREINTLRFSSFIGAVATLLLAAALAINAVKSASSGRHRRGGGREVPLARFDANAASALSTFLFSYCCQPVVFRVVSEMRGGNTRRMTLCAASSMTGCTLVYIVTGVCGAFGYGDRTQPNILSNLGGHLDELHVLLAYTGMAIAVTMVFPMSIFPTRDSVVLALGYRAEENPCPGWLSSGIAGLLAFAALVVGMLVPNIRVLFDVLGGVCGGTLSFLLPGLFALRCGEWTVEDVGVWHFMGGWALTLLGAGMCVLGTYFSIVNNFFS